MKNQRRQKPYSRESIERALMHHEITGAVRSWSPPEASGPGNRTTWRVALLEQEPEFYTSSAVYVLCCGMAAAEKAARRSPTEVT